MFYKREMLDQTFFPPWMGLGWWSLWKPTNKPCTSQVLAGQVHQVFSNSAKIGYWMVASN